MSESRRVRPTIRCLTQDFGLAPPDLGVDVSAFDDPWLAELRRVVPTSPVGQKPDLAIERPLVYWLRVPSERGATWLDETGGVVGICAVRRREGGSDEDAYEWFVEIHGWGTPLPSGSDRLRDQAEDAGCDRVDPTDAPLGATDLVEPQNVQQYLQHGFVPREYADRAICNLADRPGPQFR